jgi:hypothetical protein
MQLAFPDDPMRMLFGYDEGLLSADGEKLIQRTMDCMQGAGPLRFAVYLHSYDPNRRKYVPLACGFSDDE